MVEPGVSSVRRTVSSRVTAAMPLGLTETSAATAEAAQVWVGVQASAATEKTVERGSAQSFGVVSSPSPGVRALLLSSFSGVAAASSPPVTSPRWSRSRRRTPRSTWRLPCRAAAKVVMRRLSSRCCSHSKK